MKLAIFDKDGTLTTPRSGEKFVQHPEDQVLLPGVAEKLRQLVEDGWTMAIASNQGGVEAGHKTINEAIAEMRYCLELLPMIDCAIFAPYFEGNVAWLVRQDPKALPDELWLYCKARKPSQGMPCYLIDQYRPDLASILRWHEENALFVGDRPEDQQAAVNAGVRFHWAKNFFGG